ncbi:MAG: pentapeptide repeat-containing protein [Desulfobacteraceae bacterium]|nr:pentapeptide repeat-containing protein [Desulfobacteraceae bacterium]
MLVGTVTGAFAIVGATKGVAFLIGSFAAAGAVISPSVIADALIIAGALATGLTASATITLAALAALAAYAGVLAGVFILADAAGVSIGGVVGIYIIILNCYIAWHITKEDKQFAGLRKIGIILTTFGGTNFKETNLTEAQFSSAILKNSCFKNTVINRTCWRDAKQLEFACVTGTILESLNVRELLVTGKTEIKSFTGIDLKGAYLADINLDGINFTEADLSGATFENTSLKNTNLSKVQCFGVEFRDADLTGACLESWNTDSTTQLEGVKCDYIYFDNERTKRFPKDRNFKPGAFEELYKQLPTFEYFFKEGFTPVDAILINEVVQEINKKHPDFELKLDSFSSRSEPHAKFTIIDEDHIKKAFELVSNKYEEKIRILEGVKDELQKAFSSISNQPKNVITYIIGEINKVAVSGDGGTSIVSDSIKDSFER